MAFADLGDLLLKVEGCWTPRIFLRRPSVSAPLSRTSESRPPCARRGAMSEAEVEASRGAPDHLPACHPHPPERHLAGAVDWMEGQSPMSFSSDLELLSLVDRIWRSF